MSHAKRCLVGSGELRDALELSVAKHAGFTQRARRPSLSPVRDELALQPIWQGMRKAEDNAYDGSEVLPGFQNFYST